MDDQSEHTDTSNDFQAPSSTFAMQDTDWTGVYPRANFTVPAFVTKDAGIGGGHPKQALSDNVTCVNGLEALRKGSNRYAV